MMVKRAGRLEQKSFSISIASDSEALSSELAYALIPDLERRRGDCLPPIELPPNPTDMSGRVRFHDNWIFDFPGYREQKFHRQDARLVVLSEDPWERRVARLAADKRTLTPGRIVGDLGIAVYHLGSYTAAGRRHFAERFSFAKLWDEIPLDEFHQNMIGCGRDDYPLRSSGPMVFVDPRETALATTCSREIRVFTMGAHFLLKL